MPSIEQRLQIYVSASVKFLIGVFVCLFFSLLGDIWGIMVFSITFFVFQKKLAKAVSIVPLKPFWIISGIILSLLYLKFSVEFQTKMSCLQRSGDSLFGYALYTIWTSILVWEAYFYGFVYKKLHFVKTMNVSK